MRIFKALKSFTLYLILGALLCTACAVPLALFCLLCKAIGVNPELAMPLVMAVAVFSNHVRLYAPAPAH